MQTLFKLTSKHLSLTFAAAYEIMIRFKYIRNIIPSIKKVLLTLLLFLSVFANVNATTIVSRATGNWTSDATWIYYCTGTASFTSGSTTVTGTGTFFSAELSNGSILLLQSSSGTVRGTVSSITNNTTLILTSVATATASGSYGKEKAPTDGASEDITINGGFTVTTDFSVDFDINSLTISGSSILTHSVNKKIVIAAGLTVDGTLDGASNRNVQVNNSAAAGILLSGTGNISLSAGDIELKGDVTVPATANLTFNAAGLFDMNGNTVTSDGQINILNPANFTASGTLINNSSTSYLKYTTQADFPNITLTATASGNTVEFGWSTGSYQIENAASYYNVIISGGGTKKTDNNTIVISGNLTIGNGNIFDASTGSDDIAIYGNWDNDNGGSFSASSGNAVTFAGTANNQTIYTPTAGETFGNLIINNTYGTVASTGNIYVLSGNTLTMTAGTFNMSTYILDEASGTAAYTQTGGDLQLAKLSTVLPQFSGTYTISGGTITLNGSGAQTIRAETVSSPIIANYYHLVLGGSGIKTMEGDLDVNGDLTIGGASQLDASNSNNSSNIKNITLAGNWINTSTASDPFLERTGTVTFDAANDVNLTASVVSGGETFYNLTINKTTSTDDLTLNNAATVSNSLTLTTGHIITTSSQYLIMGSASSLGSTPTDNSHVSGPMQKICASTSAFVFPIGKSGSYRWLEITPTSSSSTTFTSEYFYSSPASNTSAGAGVDHVSDVEYWSLDRSGSANADVKLSWTTNSAVTTNTSDLLVVQWDGSSSWVNRCGGSCSVTGGSTTSAGSISASGISTFGNSFTLASPNSNNELGNSRYSVANGNWSSTAVWAARSGGTAGASAPTSNKKVIIEGGFRVDVDAASACQKLTVGNNGIGILDFNATTNDLDVGSDGITINSNGDVEGTNSGADLRTVGSIVLNADISSESGGGSSAFVLRRLTTGGGTISGTGTCDNLDIDAATTNNGNITINSIFQGGNTLTNAGTLVFKGTNINFAGGTLTATTAGNTVEFNNTTAGFNLDEKTTYYHLTLTGNGTKDFNGSGMTINGNLTINIGSTLDGTTNEDISLSGNFINYGTFTPSTSATKEITFSGSSEQQITSGGSCFYRLYIANTSSTGVVLQDAACINTGGKIDLSDGYLYLGNNNLSLNGTATSPTSASSSSFIVTNGTGTLSAVCSNITFPVGSTGSPSDYTPVTINNSGTSDTYFVSICDNATTDGTCSGTAITSGVVNKMWQISEGVAGGSNVSLTLQWNVGNEGGSFTRTAAMIAHYTVGQWNAEQTATAASGSGPYTLNVSGLTSFSPYGVMSSAAPLPVELLSFSAKLNSENKVDIRWATASEINNDLFAIERSKDGKYFEVIEQVPGAGNSNHLIMYFAEDKNPFEGVSYYRLKQIDFDGTTTYSAIVAINSSTEQSVMPVLNFSLYPNPTSSTVFLSFSNVMEAEQVELSIYDLSGKHIYSSMTNIEVDGDIAVIDASAFPTGIYLVSAVCNGVVMHQKLLVARED